MSLHHDFRFPVSVLLQEADFIVAAGQAHTTDVTPRLPTNFLTTLQTLLETCRSEDTEGKIKVAELSTLTRTQQEALALVEDLVSRAKESARRAFRGDSVKLANEFQIGNSRPHDLAHVIERARVVRDACLVAENATALAAQGWLASDTTALADAIDALDASLNLHETGKASKAATTDERVRNLNSLYAGLLTLQNAANIAYPARVGTNAAIRQEFHLDTFPPREAPKETPAPPTPPTP